MSNWLDAIADPLGTVTKRLQELMEVRDLFKYGDTFRKMHDEILTAQRGATAGYAREMSLLQQMGQLEKKVTEFETWKTDKDRHELKHLGWGAYAYMLKPNARGAEPAHWACTNCYSNKKISVIQHNYGSSGARYACPACHAEINPSHDAFANGVIKWLD